MHRARFYTLTASCPDQVGIIARVTGFIAEHKGWILESSFHADEVPAAGPPQGGNLQETGAGAAGEPASPPSPGRGRGDSQELGRYFMRIEVKADSLPFHLAEFRSRFQPLATELQMDWRINDSAVKKRVVVLVSKQEHCLYDLLARWQSKELDIEIPCVISNHDTFKGFVEWHGIPFHHVPVPADNKAAAYAEVQRLFEEVARRHHGAGALHADSFARTVRRLSGSDPQHPPQLPALLRRRQALPPGLHARRQADRRDLPLRDRRRSTRARSSSRT